MTAGRLVPRSSFSRHCVRWRSAAFGITALLSTMPSCARAPVTGRSVLLDTTRSAERAPDDFRVRFETSRGPFVMQVNRAWSPFGVDRFYYLVRRGFYDDTRFFRVIPGYIAQFGMSGDPQITSAWRQRIIPDDTVKHQSNTRGRVAFASSGPHSRITQLFINLRDNSNFDENFAPIGEIVEGMAFVDSLWSGYGDHPGPDQARVFVEGNQYLSREFPKLDYIKTARLVQ
jgi:peptidyl-prolyl cis-trans isomerase A (cyclophilin A)